MNELRENVTGKNIRFVIITLFLFLQLGLNVAVADQVKYKESSVNQYGTITYERARLIESLAGEMDESNVSPLNQTFFVRASYTQGISTYYLLEDLKGKEVGYVSASSVTLTGDKQEGVKQSLVQYEVIHSDKYPLFADFTWKEKQDSAELINQKIRIKGAYHHFNGSIYYDTYDLEGNWLGLLDSQATETVEATDLIATKEAETTTSTVVQETTESLEEEKKESTIIEEESPNMASIREMPMETNLASVNLSTYFISGVKSGRSTRVQRQEEQGSLQPSLQVIGTPQAFQEITFSSKQEFVNLLAQDAQVIGAKYGIYPSVMIAQAILESGYGESKLTKEANNFYGMKFTAGVDEGSFERYDIYSDEFVNGQRVSLPASFRKYPTAKDSLEDYAKKIAQGVNWDKHFYRGAWRSVAKTYQEATKSLTGKYATDPEYDQKLNQIISNWNLSQYD